MGYVDKEIIRQRKALGDAVSGKNLRTAIRKLQEKSQIKDSLAEARLRGDIIAKRKLAKPTGSAQGDFTELLRTFHTTQRTLRSTDGLFVVAYYNVKNIVMDRATFTYLDHDPDA